MKFYILQNKLVLNSLLIIYVAFWNLIMSKSEILPIVESEKRSIENSIENSSSKENPFFYRSNLHTDIKQLITKITDKSDYISSLTTDLREDNIKNEFKIPTYMENYILETKLLSKQFSSTNISSLNIGSVDGGVVVKSLANIDIIAIKAVGIFINYGKNTINRIKYIPDKHQEIKLVPSFENFSNTDLELYSSLQRSILELQTGIKVLNESPATLDYLLMDGSFQLKRSLSVHPEINMLQGKYFAYLRKLHNLGQKFGSKIIFVVKDSRLRVFTDLLNQLLPHIITSYPSLYKHDYRNIIDSTRDSNFMYHFLNPKSRSFIINRRFQKDITEIQDNPFSFYLKIIKNDIPLRIDFLQPKNKTKEEITSFADEISELIIPLSEFNSFYSLPAPIIEADARARINIEEFELIINSLRKMTIGNSIDSIPMRRGRSPFKF